MEMATQVPFLLSTTISILFSENPILYKYVVWHNRK